MEKFRKQKSTETANTLSDELHKHLFAGLKDSNTAAERAESVSTLKAITLTVTTRAIEFATTHIFSTLYEYNNVPVNGTIYQLYRVALAAVQCKVTYVQRGVTDSRAHIVVS